MNPFNPRALAVLSLVLCAGCGENKRAEEWAALKSRTSKFLQTKSEFEDSKRLLHLFIQENKGSNEAEQAEMQLIVLRALEGVAADSELKKITREVEQALAGGRIKDAEEAISRGTFREPGSPDYAALREKIRVAREGK